METAAAVPRYDGATEFGGIKCHGRQRFFSRGNVSARFPDPIATIPVPVVYTAFVGCTDDGPIHGGRVQSTTTTTFTTTISATIHV